MTTATVGWVGRILAGGHYEVIAKLGEGGMGHVYRARDSHLNCDVVIKVPHAAMFQDPEFAGRFAREIKALVRLTNKHVVKISDVGEHDGLPFAVMQYLAGGSLRKRLQQGPDGNQRQQPGQELIAWLKDISEALDFIHSQGYVHRDVKPDNILFDEHGNVYLSDFGIAKALADSRPHASRTVYTATGMFVGTPHYMAPELHQGEPYDGRVDQYALAVTIYEMLTGNVPFDGRTPTAICEKQKKPPMPLDSLVPTVPKAVAAAVQQALIWEQEQRFPTCTAFAQAVLDALGKATPVAVGTLVQKVPATCPGCRQASMFLATDQGKQVSCPTCRTEFRVPIQSQGEPTLRQAGTADTSKDQQAKLDTSTHIGRLQDALMEGRIDKHTYDRLKADMSVAQKRQPSPARAPQASESQASDSESKVVLPAHVGASKTATWAVRGVVNGAKFGSLAGILSSLILVALFHWFASSIGEGFKESSITMVIVGVLLFAVGGGFGGGLIGVVFGSLASFLTDNPAVLGKPLTKTVFGIMLLPAVVSVLGAFGSKSELRYARIVDEADGYLRNEDYDRAIEAYTEAARINPNKKTAVSARLEIAYFNRGMAYVEKHEVDHAISDFSEAIVLRPSDKEAYRARGAAYTRKGKLSEAISDLNEAIHLDPNDAESFAVRAQAHTTNNSHDLAIADLNEAIRLNPSDARLYYNRGVIHSVKEEYDQATADYTEAIRLDPQDAGSYINRANCYLKGRKFSKAIDDCSSAIRVDPKAAKAYWNRSVAYAGLGQGDKAKADRDEAVRLDPSLGTR